MSGRGERTGFILIWKEFDVRKSFVFYFADFAFVMSLSEYLRSIGTTKRRDEARIYPEIGL